MFFSLLLYLMCCISNKLAFIKTLRQSIVSLSLLCWKIECIFEFQTHKLSSFLKQSLKIFILCEFIIFLCLNNFSDSKVVNISIRFQLSDAGPIFTRCSKICFFWKNGKSCSKWSKWMLIDLTDLLDVPLAKTIVLVERSDNAVHF